MRSTITKLLSREASQSTSMSVANIRPVLKAAQVH